MVTPWYPTRGKIRKGKPFTRREDEFYDSRKNVHQTGTEEGEMEDVGEGLCQSKK